MRGCGRRGREGPGEAGKKGRERGAEGGGGGEGEGGKEERLRGKRSRGEGESSGGFAVPAARCPQPGAARSPRSSAPLEPAAAFSFASYFCALFGFLKLFVY